jgi:hypothetical protein
MAATEVFCGKAKDLSAGLSAKSADIFPCSSRIKRKTPFITGTRIDETDNISLYNSKG